MVLVRSLTPGATDGDQIEIVVEFLGVDAAGRATPLANRLLVSTADWSIIEAEGVSRAAS